MTIFETLAKFDALIPNDYTIAEKIGWLSELDGLIKTEIIDTHEGGEDIVFTGYDENIDQVGTVLLVPAPYEDIYMKWLEAKVNYANAEYNKYNNSVTAYNAVHSAYERYYNRNHIPISKKKRFIF